MREMNNYTRNYKSTSQGVKNLIDSRWEKYTHKSTVITRKKNGSPQPQKKIREVTTLIRNLVNQEQAPPFTVKALFNQHWTPPLRCQTILALYRHFWCPITVDFLCSRCTEFGHLPCEPEGI